MMLQSSNIIKFLHNLKLMQKKQPSGWLWIHILFRFTLNSGFDLEYSGTFLLLSPYCYETIYTFVIYYCYRLYICSYADIHFLVATWVNRCLVSNSMLFVWAKLLGMSEGIQRALSSTAWTTWHIKFQG